MPKQINVKLGFEADTSQAKKQIADLQKSLDGLLSSSIKEGALNGFDQQISNAQQSVLKLKTAINNSLNADTGRLDLSKFNTQLNNSGLTLSKLSQDMNGLGADGQKAFLNLANSIITAQKPMAESNKLLDNMWTALKNTARWQLSSSILHGFMGALQGAFGYAQDLNKSLTDIAIVTGRSTDQMADFAEQANKSAQALSVSTTAYTDAALIYYQQGLSDEEVKARTDITMQMSNVTGESAEHVSSYMTAIWNNFAKGSENLDHFADVITALGAATASSSEEIANGMQQFAAVADTVGLSYEYAATALATVVAQTRQSESTVGNSFRTIFSRLQGLKLGNTLEDGTDLNKYSEALAKVGVNIKDQNGELKEMDTILDEIGAKWGTLAKDQQIALAQTVGGVRQYTNLVALFDNWDTFQENLQVANSSDGALQQQAKTYEEGWEAALKRVKAAWQAIYQDLIDDKFFITILNGIEKILHGVDGLIDSIGGLPGVLSAVGVIITSVFGDKLVGSLQNAQQQLKVFTGTAQAESNAMTLWVKNNLDAFKADDGIIDSTTLSVNLTKQRLALTIQLRDIYDQLTDTQKQYAEGLLTSVERQQQLTLEAKRTAEATKEQADDVMRQLRSSAVLKGNNGNLTSYLSSGELKQEITLLNQLTKGTKEWNDQYDFIINSFRSSLQPIGDQEKLLVKVVDAQVKVAESEKEYANAKQVTQKEVILYNQRLQELVKGHHNGTISTQELISAIEQEEQRLISEQGEIARTTEEYKKLEEQKRSLQQSNQGILGPDFAQNIVNSFKGVSQLTMGLNSLSSAFDALGDKDLSWIEKLQRFTTGVSFGTPALLSGGKQVSNIYNQIYSYFGQKAANQGIQSVINENISRMNEIKGALNNSTGSAWFSEDTIFEVTNLKNELKELEQTNKTLSSGIKGGLTVWKDLGTAFKNAGTNILNFLVDAGPFLAWVAAAAAAIYVLKKAWDAWYENTPEGKLEAANKELEESKKKVEETSKAYQEAKAGLEEYAEAVERISKMDPGSERSEAIVEENNKILELLDSLDAWSKIGEIKYDSTGLIQLTETQKNILENDYKREASLARQAEYQSKINQITAQSDVDYKNEYDGKKIKLTRQTGTTTVEGGGQTHEVGVYESQDVTREIASILNEAGLTASSNDEKIVDALKNAGFSSEEITNTLLPAINEIAANTAKLQEFNDLQSDVAGTDAQTDAIRTQEIRDTLSQSDEFNNLTEESQEIAIERLKEKWDSVKESIRESIDNQEDLTEAFKNAGLEVDNLNLKWQTVHQAIADIDEDIDEDELASLSNFLGSTKIEGLSDQLLEIDEAAQGVAESILRFDDAIQDVADNYEDWTRSLKTGTLQDQAKTMSELEDAYSDLLDLNFGSLDSNFLGDVENLELLKKACEGSEEAYNQLQEKAKENILGQVGLDTTDFDNKFLELDSKIQAGLDDIEVGAFVDDTQALQAMNELINAADMTAEQATDLLASMGVDAEVEQVTVPEKQRQALIDAKPDISYKDVPVPSIVQDGTGDATVNNTTVKVPTINYEPIKAEESVEGEKTATMLRVTSARKSTGGGFKFQHASRGGGAAPKSSKSSGGGGKGSGSSKKPEVKEHKEHVKKEDRYHDIKEQLEDVRLEYDKVNKAKDRAFGKSKLKYLDQEIKKLKEEESLLGEYRKEAEAYAKVDRAALEGTGMGAKFDENGALTNYEQVLANIDASYNKAIDTYNKAVDVYNKSPQEEADKEILERANKELEAQKKVYDDRIKKLDQYEDTYNLWQEQVWNELQKHWEAFDKQVEKITTKIEIELDFNENDRKLLEWMYSHLGDEADYAADRIANLSKQMGEVESDIEWYKTGLKDIFSLHNINLDFDNLNADSLVSQLQDFMKDNNLQSEFTEEEVQSVRNYLNGLMDSYDQLKDIADEVHENVTNGFDQFNERLERQLDIFDRLNSKLAHYQKIVDLTGRKTLKMSSDEVRALNQALVDNAQNQLASTKKIMDEIGRERENAKKQMEYFQSIGDEQSFNYWEDIFNQLDDEFASATERYYSSFENALQLSNEAFERSMELMKEDYNDALGDLNQIAEQFSRQKELDELYLPDYKKYHELNKSTKELNKSLANTNNTLIKGKMNDLMDEINQKMENGVQISGYETEIIARRVALLQAEAELQNAKNAKSAVRMTRDNEGNFSYTYTADQNKISDAEQNVSDKFYELLDYERTSQNEIQEQMIQKQQEFVEKLAEINEKYKGDEAGRMAALEKLMEDYHQWMDFYASQDQILMFEMGRLRDEDLQDIERITGLKLADNENFISTWEQTIYGRLMPGYDNAEEALEAWRGAADNTLRQANSDADRWEEEVEETYKEAGTDAEDFKDKVHTELGQVQEESDKTRKSVEDMVDDPEKGMKKKMDEAMTAAGEFDKKYSTTMGNIRTEIGNTVKVLNEMLQKLNQTYQEQQKLNEEAKKTAESMNAAATAARNLAAAQAAVGSGGGGGGSTYVPSSGGGTSTPSAPKTYTYEVQDPVYGRVGLGVFGSDADAMAKFNSYFNAHSQAGWYKLLRDGVVISQKQKAAAVTGYSSAYTPSRGSSTMRSMAFDTGGYTGDWGTTDGKMAILHQKEIVLNQEDTKNLLQSVDIVRGIADMLKTQQVPQTNINYSGVFAAAGAGALQQQVHIDASFPNVQSHSEIELALNNLINSASQYVNRK